MSAAAGAPAPVFRPFPEERKRIDIGSYATDSTLIREELGWQPRVGFDEGVRKSLEYFLGRLDHYLGPGADQGVCPTLV